MPDTFALQETALQNGHMCNIPNGVLKAMNIVILYCKKLISSYEESRIRKTPFAAFTYYVLLIRNKSIITFILNSTNEVLHTVQLLPTQFFQQSLQKL